MVKTSFLFNFSNCETEDTCSIDVAMWFFQSCITRQGFGFSGLVGISFSDVNTTIWNGQARGISLRFC